MDEYNFIFSNSNTERLDIFLSKQLKNSFSRVEIQKMIKNNQAKINNYIVNKPSMKLKQNDIILIKCQIKKKETILKPKDIKLDIVFENENLIIINKPTNLTVHPGAGNNENTLVNGLLYLKKDGKITLSNERGEERLGIVHRLDKDTSGLMIIAKNNKSHRLLAELIKNHKIDRRYIALCHGVPIPPVCKIENYICRDTKCIQKMKICNKDDKNSKIAITNYRVLKTIKNGKYSLVECKLETGRTHQIRLHMLSINHPIVGDQLYTKGNYKNEDKNNNFNHQMLHSYKLSFFDPVNGEKIELENINCAFKNIFL